jgi:hypothetical protein
VFRRHRLVICFFGRGGRIVAPALLSLVQQVQARRADYNGSGGHGVATVRPAADPQAASESLGDVSHQVTNPDYIGA